MFLSDSGDFVCVHAGVEAQKCANCAKLRFQQILGIRHQEEHDPREGSAGMVHFLRFGKTVNGASSSYSPKYLRVTKA